MSANDGNYWNKLKLEFGYNGSLPLGLTYSGTISFEDYLYNHKTLVTTINGGKKDKELNINWEFELFRTIGLYKTENYALDMKLTSRIGAEYRNWGSNNENGSSTQNWRWQPFALCRSEC